MGEDYLADEDGYALKLSHALLKTTYDNNDLISCLQQDENQDQDDNQGQNAEVETKEVCENLYEASAKCEEVHGFDNGINKYYNLYANQDNNEELVCSFIDSLLSGTYSQDGKLLLEELQVIKVQEELQQRVGRSLRLPSLSLEPSDLQYMQQCFMHNLQRVESPICQLKVVQWLKKLVIFFIYFIIAHS